MYYLYKLVAVLLLYKFQTYIIILFSCLVSIKLTKLDITSTQLVQN